MEGDNKPVPVNRQNFLAVHPAGLRGAAAGTRRALHAADTVACTAVL